eukprot:Plantae.Rhodophyta-Hildenbrandia_rubra.ctg10223.p2 GENE.Plantae.Rhodophyta-Hildenbrandia_rubra.ctg10223~~Plantae.Rhodophyta-Hildenbrandia_rubra.ctg10223.p2  ORF type:complete len:426 (+),score=83.54 Plantae.Rhodophyta-Hildenbrandia_rubra.ctg10223:3311-4588(+)
MPAFLASSTPVVLGSIPVHGVALRRPPVISQRVQRRRRPCHNITCALSTSSSPINDNEARNVIGTPSKLKEGKDRVRRHLLEALPKMFEGREVWSWMNECASDDIEFSWPLWRKGRGRRFIGMLLSMIKWQVRWGILENASVCNIVVDSPMKDLLVVRYQVKADIWEAEDCGDGEEDEEKVKETMFWGRSRLRFADDGKIVRWDDEWSKSPREFLREVLDIKGYGLDELEDAEDWEEDYSTTLYIDPDDPTGAPQDRSKVELMAARKESQIQMSRTSRLSPEQFKDAVLDLKVWLEREFPRLLVKDETNLDFSGYSKLVEVDNPWVKSSGLPALELICEFVRWQCKVMFKNLNVRLVSIHHPATRLVCATYFVRGESRLGGSVEFVVRSSFQLSGEGKVVRQSDWWSKGVSEILMSMWRRPSQVI